MIGETIQNRYKIENELGRGGMGTVYRAYDTLLKRDVAIKVLNLEGIDKESRDRLLREAQFSAQLHHPNIATTFDVGDSDGAPFIVMELVEGHSLYEYKPKDFEEKISFARSICTALEHAHDHDIVHRDLKPENVLVNQESEVKLVDFGLARPTASRLTVEGQITGTVYYLAPELIKGQRYDGRADLYAFGIILYELLTGELPFKGENPVAVISQHLNEEVVPPVELKPDIPSSLNQLVIKLLQKEPGNRPASAGEVIQILDRLDQPMIEEIPLEVEGKPEPRPKQPEFLEKDAGDRKPPPLFVAKERQLNKLDNYLQTALEGEGKVIFVCGGPGRGKTALVDEFARRATLEHPELLVAKGSCNAYSGIGDAYLPFREIMVMLGGDVEAQWKAGAVTTEHARRLWRSFPLLVQALLEWGPNLLETFLSGKALLERSKAAAPERGDMLEALTREVERSKRIPEGLDQSRLFEQFTNVINKMADDYPLLLVLDDLHWADTASISLLFHLGRRITTDRILIVGAYRPEELALGWEGKRHPLEKIMAEFTLLFGDITVDLAEEGEAEGLQFVEALLDSEPNLLDDSFQQALYAHTGGHPLFTIELLRSLQDRGELLLDDGGYWTAGPTVDWDNLPARVEAVIAERISRLERELREILAVASVEGEDFTVQVVAQVQGLSERQALRMLSGDLEKRHRLVRELSVMQLGHQQISRYRFTHALFQQYLYQDLSYRERTLLNRQIAEAIEEYHSEHLTPFYSRLAYHWNQVVEHDHSDSILVGKAVDYSYKAGQQAKKNFANQEAIEFFNQAITLLNTLPDNSERAQQELNAQTALGSVLLANKGYGAPEVKKTYDRARELCLQVGDTPQLSQVLWGLGRFYLVRTPLQTCRELGEQLLNLANKQQNPELFLEAHNSLGAALTHLGELSQAQEHLERGFTIYNPQQHFNHALIYGQDPGVVCLSRMTWTLWGLGYPEQALDRKRQAHALASELAHPYSMAFALICITIFYQLLRDAHAAKKQADATISLCTKQGFDFFKALGICVRGWSLFNLGQVDEGISQLRHGMAAWGNTGAVLFLPYQLAMLAIMYWKTGQTTTSIAMLDEALNTVEKSGERFWESEIYRLKGELLLNDEGKRIVLGAVEGQKLGSESSPKECFYKAINIARCQNAKSLELRATISLCRLWQLQGKQEKARRMLTDIYDWFTEGFDTVDLKEAKALLEVLS